jgi:galacturonokinase
MGAAKMTMPALNQVSSLVERVASRFEVDRAAVRTIFSPYRICPLGAHIDHQRGPVTAMALDRGILLAYVPRSTSVVQVQSDDYAGQVEVDLNASIVAARPGDWGNYVRGAVVALQQEHALHRGFVGLIRGSLPEGGLSSSAAAGVAYLLALEDANDLDIALLDNVRLDQFIENNYLGLKNGVLDQAAILLSRRDHLTRIDCSSLQYEQWPRSPSMPAFSVMVVFSGVRKSLVQTDYNRRVEECQEAARRLLEASGKTVLRPVLGDVDVADFERHRSVLPAPLARRAEHFFSEVQRVEDGRLAWQAGDIDRFGRLVTQSGESSITNYECGSPPLIDLYRILVETPGIFGTRFSGAGFRGCCVALVDAVLVTEACEQVLQRYRRLHPELATDAAVWTCGTSDGACRVHQW